MEEILTLSKREENRLVVLNELEKFNKEIPDSREKLVTLPGVGDNAAGAYLSIHLNKGEWIVDCNIVRVFKRILEFKQLQKEGVMPILLNLQDFIYPVESVNMIAAPCGTRLRLSVFARTVLSEAERPQCKLSEPSGRVFAAFQALGARLLEKGIPSRGAIVQDLAYHPRRL